MAPDPAATPDRARVRATVGDGGALQEMENVMREFQPGDVVQVTDRISNSGHLLTLLPIGSVHTVGKYGVTESGWSVADGSLHTWELVRAATPPDHHTNLTRLVALGLQRDAEIAGTPLADGAALVEAGRVLAAALNTNEGTHT